MSSLANVVSFAMLSSIYGTPEPQVPSLADVKQAEILLYQSDCICPAEERFRALNTMKAATDEILPEAYKEFRENCLEATAELLAKSYEKHPGLYWYDHSFERVLEGVKNEKIPQGQMFIWMVYNLGFVFKTPTQCFAIDLNHRRAEELIPYLDFCCITHNHDDHYTLRFVKAMEKADKPIIRNFTLENWMPDVKPQERTLTIGNTSIKTYISDHNDKLRNFMQPVEITSSLDEGSCTIYSSGDSCNAKQLKVSRQPDFWLVHPYVGLKVEEGAELLNPKTTLCGHLVEMGHPVERWRWTWRMGYDAAKKIWDTGREAVVPVWGDKIVFKAQSDAHQEKLP